MRTKLLFLFSIICCAALTSSAQNFLDKYLTDPLTYTTIANSSNSVASPRDLDFKPGTSELWIVNYANSNGGTNVIIYNAGLPNQTSQFRKDSHTAHFMGYPSAIAFDDNGDWGSTGEIFSTCGATCTFMGPSLWSGDTNIFARVFQNNWLSNYPLGSHLDMLHQSPYSMGIAHDTANAYWVFDGHNATLCRYDFGVDHGAGHDDHSDGKIRRYTDIILTRTIGVPGHMVEDKATGWLYIADNGANRVIRVNTNTGTLGAFLTPPSSGYENLAEYRAVTGATLQVVDNFSTPCGVDVYNGRLIIGNRDNGDIRIYDITGVNPVYLGTVATGQSGIQGLKIGPDGKIWFVNNTQSTVVRIDPLPVVDDASILNITSPVVENYKQNFYSPYFDACVSSAAPAVTLLNNGSNTLSSVTINYSVDGTPYPPMPWTGSLAAGASTSVNLFGVPVTQGNRKLTVSTSGPNGTTDRNPANDSKSGSFRVISSAASLPFSQGFSTAGFPPSGWSYSNFNPNNKMTRIANVGGFGNNTGCLKMDIYSSSVYITGQRDYFISPRIDLSGSAATNLIFSVAYAQYSNSTTDTLKVLASTDCGATWTVIYNKSGATLSSTVSFVTSSFTPSASQWRSDTVSLAAYTGQPEVLFQFMTVCDDGNNIYIDDIQVPSAPTSVVQNTLYDELIVYPNPGSGNFTVEFPSMKDREAVINVYNMFGGIVSEHNINFTSGKLNLDLSALSSGNYFAGIKTSSGTFHRKLTIIK